MIGPGDGGSETFQRTAEEAAVVFGTSPGAAGEAEPAPAGRTSADTLLRRLPPWSAEVQQGQLGGEVLLGRMERAKIFGRSAINFLTADSTRTRIAEFAAGTVASAATKDIVKELLINTLGGAATGFVGRVAIGGAAGAIVGTAKEYAKQVRGNFRNFAAFEDERRRQLSEAVDADDQDRINELNARKKHFREKLKGLGPTDWGAIGKSTLRGAVFGAVGGLVASVALDMWEAGQVPGIQGVREAAGNLGKTIGDAAGGVGHALAVADASEMAGTIPGAESPDLGGIPQVATEVAEGAGQAAQEAVEGVTDDTSALAAAEEAAKEAAKEANYEFLQSTAKAVGEKIDQSYLLADEAIRAAGIDPSQLSHEAYENIRMSVQHRMEGLANEAFNHAAGSADNIDPSHLAEIVKQGHDEFVASLSGADTHQQLLKVASGTLTEHLTAQQEIAENLSQILGSTPDLATGVITAHGDTVGQMLVDHGYNITWGAADADVLGAHIAANYNQLSGMWGAMAQVDNLPPGIHFPVSLTDLPNLVEQARNGDAEALQKLKDALHWIPAGKKFMILNAGELTKILEALKKT